MINIVYFILYKIRSTVNKNKIMKVLAFDTTNEFFSISLAENSKILSYEIIKEKNVQSTMIIPKIEELLNKNKIWYEDLDAICLTIGAGSFAGVRVGVSVAKAIAISTNLKIIGVSGFEALAFPYKEEKIAVVMNARQGNMFVQLFDNGVGISEPKIIKNEEIVNIVKDNEFLLVGSGKDIAKEILEESTNKTFRVSENEDLIEAKNIALLGCEKYRNKEFTEELKPLYLRPPRICKRKSAKQSNK